jgi:hypothetical protein
MAPDGILSIRHSATSSRPRNHRNFRRSRVQESYEANRRGEQARDHPSLPRNGKRALAALIRRGEG